MIEGDKFIVFCEKLKTSDQYAVYYAANKQLSERIKLLPRPQRTWNKNSNNWELTASALFTIILGFRKSTKIFFNFLGTENRELFLKIVAKEEETNKKSVEALRKQLEKNERAIELKLEFESNVKNYEHRVLAKLKPGVTLFKHQVVAACFLEFVGSGLLSLEMGLGKTLCSIAYAEMKEFKKIVVITPNSLKYNFFNEVEKFTNSKAYIVGGKNNQYSMEESKYIIFNYEFFNPSDERKVKNKLKELGFTKKMMPECVICDESHRLKNNSSNTFLNFRRNFGKVESKVFLSGTPAPNRVSELYTVLNQISPLEFATKAMFEEFYCGIKYDIASKEWIQNPPKLSELFESLSPHTLRKRKIDVLDLPSKTYQKVFIEMDKKQAAEYAEIERGVIETIMYGDIHQTKVNPLTVMSQLRQYNSKAKLHAIAEVLERLVEEGEKVVVVDMFKETLYELNKLFPNISAVHTGDQTVEERNEIVKDFQNPQGKYKIFFGSIQTCNYGLTLTASNKLFIITLPFSVGEFDQVSDRLHRIGQFNNVTIFLLLLKETIDEEVFHAIETKRTQIVKAIDNEDYESDIASSVLNDLMSKIKKKYVR